MAWVPKMMPLGYTAPSVGRANVDEQQLVEREQRVAGAEIKLAQKEMELRERAVDIEASRSQMEATKDALVAQRTRQHGKAKELRKWQTGLLHREANLKLLLDTVRGAMSQPLGWSAPDGAPPPTVTAVPSAPMVPTAAGSSVPDPRATWWREVVPLQHPDLKRQRASLEPPAISPSHSFASSVATELAPEATPPAPAAPACVIPPFPAATAAVPAASTLAPCPAPFPAATAAVPAASTLAPFPCPAADTRAWSPSGCLSAELLFQGLGHSAWLRSRLSHASASASAPVVTRPAVVAAPAP